MTAAAPYNHALQHRLTAWPHKAPSVGIEGNNLLLKLKSQPMGKMAINRLPQRAMLGPLVYPNKFVRLDKGLYHVTAAGDHYLEKLRSAGFID